MSSVNLSWLVECLWAVVYLWYRRKSYAARVDILPRVLVRAQGGRQSFSGPSFITTRIFRFYNNKQTNKQTNKQSLSKVSGQFIGSYVISPVLTIRLINGLSWVFANQEKKKESLRGFSGVAVLQTSKQTGSKRLIGSSTSSQSTD